MARDGRYPLDRVESCIWSILYEWEADMTKYVVNFGEDFDRMLGDLSRPENPASNKSDAIRRAVALYSYLHKQVDATPGAKVAIVTLDGNQQVSKLHLVIDPLP